MKIMNKALFILCACIALASCSPKAGTNENQTAIVDSTTMVVDTAGTAFTEEPHLQEIAGNWDGSGKNKLLKEHYFSRAKGKEVISPSRSEASDSIDYMDLIEMSIKLDATSYLLDDERTMDTLFVSKGRNAQIFGVFYLKNEGDLDGDGADEIGFVPEWAQMSSTNQYYIMSYKDGKWVNYFSFPIWTWMEDFDGLVKKVDKNKFRIRFRNSEAMEDSMIIDLNKKTASEYNL